MEVVRRRRYLLMNVEYDETLASREPMNTAQQMHNKYITIEEDKDGEMEVAWDDVSGVVFHPQQVREARAGEIRFVKKIELFEKMHIPQWRETTGKAPIFVRWIDTNKEIKANQMFDPIR